MDIIKEFKDDQYPRKGDWKERRIARGVVINEDGLFAIHQIKRNDIFGNYTYYETPGGGIDSKESPALAFQRECEEELGYQVEILEEIGIIKDEYALLSRKNINYYFLAKTTKYVGNTLLVKEILLSRKPFICNSMKFFHFMKIFQIRIFLFY